MMWGLPRSFLDLSTNFTSPAARSHDRQSLAPAATDNCCAANLQNVRMRACTPPMTSSARAFRLPTVSLMASKDGSFVGAAMVLCWAHGTDGALERGLLLRGFTSIRIDRNGGGKAARAIGRTALTVLHPIPHV